MGKDDFLKHRNEGQVPGAAPLVFQQSHVEYTNEIVLCSQRNLLQCLLVTGNTFLAPTTSSLTHSFDNTDTV